MVVLGGKGDGVVLVKRGFDPVLILRGVGWAYVTWAWWIGSQNKKGGL